MQPWRSLTPPRRRQRRPRRSVVKASGQRAAAVAVAQEEDDRAAVRLVGLVLEVPLLALAADSRPVADWGPEPALELAL